MRSPINDAAPTKCYIGKQNHRRSITGKRGKNPRTSAARGGIVVENRPFGRYFRALETVRAIFADSVRREIAEKYLIRRGDSRGRGSLSQPITSISLIFPRTWGDGGWVGINFSRLNKRSAFINEAVARKRSERECGLFVS
jgi:hypothetical protein